MVLLSGTLVPPVGRFKGLRELCREFPQNFCIRCLSEIPIRVSNRAKVPGYRHCYNMIGVSLQLVDSVFRADRYGQNDSGRTPGSGNLHGSPGGVPSCQSVVDDYRHLPVNIYFGSRSTISEHASFKFGAFELLDSGDLFFGDFQVVDQSLVDHADTMLGDCPDSEFWSIRRSQFTNDNDVQRAAESLCNGPSDDDASPGKRQNHCRQAPVFIEMGRQLPSGVDAIAKCHLGSSSSRVGRHTRGMGI